MLDNVGMELFTIYWILFVGMESMFTIYWILFMTVVCHLLLRLVRWST